MFHDWTAKDRLTSCWKSDGLFAAARYHQQQLIHKLVPQQLLSQRFRSAASVQSIDYAAADLPQNPIEAQRSGF
jgi:hypothetical protein